MKPFWKNSQCEAEFDEAKYCGRKVGYVKGYVDCSRNCDLRVVDSGRDDSRWPWSA